MLKTSANYFEEQKHKSLDVLKLKDLFKLYVETESNGLQPIYNLILIADFLIYHPGNESPTIPSYFRNNILNTPEYACLYELCGVSGTSLEVNQCMLSQLMYDNFGERKIQDKYKKDISTWDASIDDYMSIVSNMKLAINAVYHNNIYKWCNLMKSCILEFNPLWNVDGTETTTRTLEQDGTETRTKTGTETDKTTGTETTARTGTETDKKTGSVDDTMSDDYFDELDGSDAIAKTGTETTTYNGSELDTLSGSDSTTQSGTIMHGTQKTTTESATFYDTEKVTDTYNTPTTTLYGKSDTKTFNNRSDAITHNTTDTTTYGKKTTSSRTVNKDTTYNVTDTLTHNTEDELTHNTTNQTTHNTTDALLRDLLDTERITKERQGNIGVTTTTKLLQEFRDYVNFNVMDVIVKDVVNAITEGVY